MEIRFYNPKIKETKILAFADVAVAEGVIVKGFKVIDGENGRFAAVPTKSITVQGSPRFINQVVFTTLEVRERFLGELLRAYERWRLTEPAPVAEEGVPF
jgi:DNA-binding cell septation regulator SpoVG